MNVALLIDYYPPNHDGGDSIFARDLAIALKGPANPLVFTRIPEKPITYEFEDDGVKVVYLGKDWKDALHEYLRRIDLVHFFQIDNLPLVDAIKEQKDVPILFHMEISFLRYSEMFVPDFNANTYLSLERRAMDISDVVVIPCDSELQQIDRLYPSANLIMVPNGINYSLRLNQHFEFSHMGKKTNFAFVGRLDDPMKGGKELVQAISNLPEDYLNRAYFMFVGTRDTRFSSQLSVLEKQLQYEIHPWISNQSQLWKLLTKAHFMLAPSKYETFGMACLEAMAMGIVPIVSDAGAMAQMVKYGTNGLVVKNSDQMFDRLVKAIVASVDMPSKQYFTMRKAAIETARSQYNIEKVVEKIIPVYNQLKRD